MIQVIKATILKYLRQRKSLLFNIFFPVFLIIILGMTLKNNFENTAVSEDHAIEVLYVDNGGQYGKEVLDILKNIGNDYKMTFVEEQSSELAKQKVRAKNAVFLEINDNNISFYGNDKFLTDSSIVYGVLKGVANSINATIEIVKVDPTLAGVATSVKEDEVFNLETIEQSKSPGAIDYYGVAELGLMIFYFFSVPIQSLMEEKKNNIKDRIKLSGVSIREYYFGIFIGNSLMAFISISISYLIAKVFLGVNYGNNILVVPLAALPFVTIVIALGIVLSLVLKDEERGINLGSSIIIPVLCFLGGGYVAFGDSINPILNVITQISPLRWFNNGLMRYIYGGDIKMLVMWVVIGISITTGLVLLINILARREELMHE